MTDNEKSVIIAVGITIAVGIVCIILRRLVPFAYALIAGPGTLVYAYVGKILSSWLILWLSEAVPQFIFIYLVSISAYSRPPYWKLRIGLLVFAWLVTGVAGYYVWINAMP